MLALPVALAAGSQGPRAQAQALRTANGSLEARESAATLELYALESQLAEAQSELAGIGSQQAAVEREQTALRRRIAVATKARRVSEARLGELARRLYEQSGRTDPIAVLLGATSLEEALTGLDGLSRAAGENNRIIEQTRSTRAKLRTLVEKLATRKAQLDRLATAAAARTKGLEAATAQRRLFLADVQRQQGLNASRIATLETRARAAATRSLELAPAATTSSAPTPAATTETRAPAATIHTSGTLTVVATGYAIHGRTATGIQTAPGVVAVDPAVIPLGTRLTIPGYGAGVAADTGGAVRGNVIDLWFPTRREALAWGTRTVTISLG